MFFLVLRLQLLLFLVLFLMEARLLVHVALLPHLRPLLQFTRHDRRLPFLTPLPYRPRSPKCV